MEAWYSAVRKLKDESEDPKYTRDFCFHVYHNLIQRKIKDKKKFRERRGPDFESWTTELNEEYSQEFITSILSDDEFWNATLKIIGV
jgi:hypothetical protein